MFTILNTGQVVIVEDKAVDQTDPADILLILFFLTFSQTMRSWTRLMQDCAHLRSTKGSLIFKYLKKD